MKDVTKLYRQFQRKVMQIDPPCMTQPESFYPEVATALITGGVTLLSIIVSAYVAGATIDDKINKEP